MNVNLANNKTTICGAIAAAFLALSVAPVPTLAPYAGVFVALSAVFGALANYFAKDATTGSAPDAVFDK